MLRKNITAKKVENEMEPCCYKKRNDDRLSKFLSQMLLKLIILVNKSARKVGGVN